MYIVKMRNPKTQKINTFESDCKNEEELHQALEIFEIGGYTEITYSIIEGRKNELPSA